MPGVYLCNRSEFGKLAHEWHKLFWPLDALLPERQNPRLASDAFCAPHNRKKAGAAGLRSWSFHSFFRATHSPPIDQPNSGPNQLHVPVKQASAHGQVVWLGRDC